MLEVLSRDYRAGGSTRRLLLSPGLPPAQRRQYLEHLLGPSLAGVLALLAGRGRAHLFPAMARAYGQLLAGGRVRVTTAFPLDPAGARLMQEAIARVAPGAAVEYAEDPALMAGALVQVGDWQWDGSARGRIQRLETVLRSKVGASSGR